MTERSTALWDTGDLASLCPFPQCPASATSPTPTRLPQPSRGPLWDTKRPPPYPVFSHNGLRPRPTVTGAPAYQHKPLPSNQPPLAAHPSGSRGRPRHMTSGTPDPWVLWRRRGESRSRDAWVPTSLPPRGLENPGIRALKPPLHTVSPPLAALDVHHPRPGS